MLAVNVASSGVALVLSSRCASWCREIIRNSPIVMKSARDDDLAALRRSFYRSEQDESGSDMIYNQHSSLHAKRAQLLGMQTSLPAIYADVPLLPQSQSVLDVWQRPDAFSPALEPYILLFESLLETPQPWLYVHATTLEAGKARAAGTLMRVANTKRTSDGRLQVLVQGLAKVRILNESRSEPFPRVDVQVQVDAEALVRAEVALSAAEEAINPRGGGGPDSADGLKDDDVAAADANEWDRLCLASALAREREWWAYEAAGFDDAAGGGMPGRLVPLNSSVAVGATHRQAEESAAHAVAEAKDAWSNAGATVAAEDDAYSWAGLDDWFMDIAGAEAAEAEAEAERCARVAALERRPPELTAALSEARDLGLSRPEELEIAIWVELDALLRSFATRNANLPPEEQEETPRVPNELLALLPHRMPDSLGAAAAWPEGFQLYRMLELSSTFLGGEGGGGAGEEGGKARVSSAYPAWRRAARLSYALSDVLAQVAGGEGDARVGDGVGGAPSPIAELLQEMLEAASTSDRLRIALRTLRGARRRLG